MSTAGSKDLASLARKVRKPIIVIGAGRSGTSILSELLAVHPDVAYWGEPRPIWMYGHAYRRDHVLRAEDLTPRIARYIDGRFAEFLERSAARRFMEKTPSNCLRIPFIFALYPDCRIVNVIRDGRAMIRSTVEIRKRSPEADSLLKRLWDTPIFEWPAYVPMFFDTVFRTMILKRPARYWGAQPPGWRRHLHLPPHVQAALQWKALVEVSLRDGRVLPPESYLEVRFERLASETADVLAEVMDFAELPPSEEVFAFARRKFDPKLVRAWSSTLSEDEEREAIRAMQPLLAELGYGGED